jgi:membrane-associated PAP2 superfamily phosphatase
MAALMPLPLTRQPTRHTVLRDAAAIIAGLVLLMAWEIVGLDLPLARLYGSAQGFAWRDHWLTGGVLHGGARALAWGLFGVLVLGLWWPLPFVRRLSRRERVWWLATTLVCVSLIPLLKRTSATSCPWALAEFGSGLAQYVPHWLLGVQDGGPGGCFPSGHASTAFAFLTGWFALRDPAPRAARLWLIVTVAAGVGLGWVQMMRGAHYLSHSLWTAWVCWTVAALSFHLARSWRTAVMPVAVASRL